MSQCNLCSVEIAAQKKPACHDVIPGIVFCPECGAPCCPTCGRHSVVQLSRVTGYVSSVGGWNEGKKQELKDRVRYAVPH